MRSHLITTSQPELHRLGVMQLLESRGAEPFAPGRVVAGRV